MSQRTPVDVVSLSHLLRLAWERHTCVRACVRAYMCVCMRACLIVCVYVRMCAYACLRTHLCTCVSVCVRVGAGMRGDKQQLSNLDEIT